MAKEALKESVKILRAILRDLRLFPLTIVSSLWLKGVRRQGLSHMRNVGAIETYGPSLSRTASTIGRNAWTAATARQRPGLGGCRS
jgi:hypothetical protein